MVVNKDRKRVFADPTVDFAFKRIFGTEKYKAATIGLLNSIIEGVNIVDVEFRITTCWDFYCLHRSFRV